MSKLQILIPTIGKEGINEIIRQQRPEVDGVEYLVSWQQPDEDLPIPPELLRHDFKIKIIKSRGVARNRNSVLAMATAPILLWSDSDCINTREHIETVLQAFEKNPDADIITFRTLHPDIKKADPDYSFDYPNMAKGYYAGAPEIALRKPDDALGIVFNEHFGIGAHFPAGEEDIFLHDCVRSGLRWRYLPVIGAKINGDSTSQRIDNTAHFIQTKGAMLLHINPCTWPLRMLAHTCRYRHHPHSRGMLWYIGQWLKGVAYATRFRVFKKSNYVAEEGQ